MIKKADTKRSNSHQAWYQTVEGEAYVSEWVIPLVKSLPNEGPLSKELSPVKPLKMPTRQFVPGSEWLYLRVYGSEVGHELVLEHLEPLLRRHSGLFFFVRYADPEPHLRLRWHILPDQFARRYRSIQRRLSPLLESGLIYRFDLGTYQRELERYGGEAITMWEEMFSADTTVFRFWLNGLKRCQLPATDEERYRHGILQVGRLLDAMGLSLQSQKMLITSMQQTFLQEKPKPTALRKILNEQYRLYGEQMFRPMDEREQSISDEFSYLLNHIKSALKEYTCVVEPSLINGNVTPELSALTGAIHMCMNRLFVSEARNHELVVYHFLARHLASQMAHQQ